MISARQLAVCRGAWFTNWPFNRYCTDPYCDIDTGLGSLCMRLTHRTHPGTQTVRHTSLGRDLIQTFVTWTRSPFTPLSCVSPYLVLAVMARSISRSGCSADSSSTDSSCPTCGVMCACPTSHIYAPACPSMSSRLHFVCPTGATPSNMSATSSFILSF